MERQLKPDAVMKDYWRNNRRFSTLVNAILFEGEQVVSNDDIEELDTDESTIVNEDSQDPRGINRNRDLLKRVVINNIPVVIGIENQQKCDLQMVLRDLEYTSLYYTIQRKNGKKEILPVLTIVMYYGEDEWKYPKNIKSLVKVPKELDKYVNDWCCLVVALNQFDCITIKDEEVRNFTEAFLELYKWNKDIKSLKSIDLTYESALSLGVITKTESLIDAAIKMNGGVVNMCRAVEEALKESEQKGKQAGLLAGKQAGLLEGKQQMMLELLRLKLTNTSKQLTILISESNHEQLDLLVKNLPEINKEEDVISILN